jgi:hypothetical protein
VNPSAGYGFFFNGLCYFVGWGGPVIVRYLTKETALIRELLETSLPGLERDLRQIQNDLDAAPLTPAARAAAGASELESLRVLIKAFETGLPSAREADVLREMDAFIGSLP